MESIFRAEVGDTVYFFGKQRPTANLVPTALIVAAVGLNGRVDGLCINKPNPVGGGRETSAKTGVVPGDVEATSQQLVTSGTWMPRKAFIDWRDKFPSMTMAQYLAVIVPNLPVNPAPADDDKKKPK